MIFNYMFRDMDSNSDGGVSLQEYKEGQHLLSELEIKRDFNFIDSNKDGKITHEELLNSFERRKH